MNDVKHDVQSEKRDGKQLDPKIQKVLDSMDGLTVYLSNVRNLDLLSTICPSLNVQMIAKELARRAKFEYTTIATNGTGKQALLAENLLLKDKVRQLEERLLPFESESTQQEQSTQ